MDDSIANIFLGQSGPDVQKLDGIGMALRRVAMGADPAGGLAPYGLRHGGNGAKGLGYFGPLATADGGYATEISADDESGQFPLLVPTLTREELAAILAGNDPTDGVYAKARAFAAQRRAAGKSTFRESDEFQYPLPGR